MSRNNDDGIERFFRKATNQSDSSHLKEDWRKMEKMLDDEFGSSGIALPDRRWRQLPMVIAMLALVSTVVYLSVREGDLQVGEVTPPERTRAADREEVLERADRSADLLSEKGSPDDHNASSATEEFSAQRSATYPKDVTSSRARSATHDGNTHTFTVASPLKENSNTVVTSAPADNDQSAAANKSARPPVPEPEPGLKESETREETAATDPLASEPERKDTTTDESDHTVRPSRWFIALAMAPDFSTTALNRYSAPGSAFGLTVGYRFHERFHLTAGVVKSFKRYRGYGYEYAPPEGYWERRTNGVIPDLVDGQCNVLEIPVAVRADLYAHPKNRLYTTVGASGYIMLDESYSYIFHNPNPGADGSWSSDRTSRYNMAALNFSLGYERALFGNTSLGVEPYVKMPVAGIGWTDIKLFSVGAYVTLRHGISGTRSKTNPNSPVR